MWFNTSHDWTQDLKDSTELIVMKMAINIAIMNAIKENYGIPSEDYISKLGKTMDVS